MDDRLPTVNGKLAFIQSLEGSTFWAPLLEKAFAKLHGSYEALKYGCSLEGLADLTGGATENINLREDPAACRQTLHRLLSMTCLITAVVPNDAHSSKGSSPYGDREAARRPGSSSSAPFERLPSGIMLATNYRITGLERVTTVDRESLYLVRLLHPLGSGSEYMGSFSRDSRDWLQIANHDRLRCESLEEDCDQDIGFWMSWHDFVKTFSALEVVFLDGETSRDEPSLRGKLAFSLKIFRGLWRRGVSAGGCRNHVDVFHTNPQLEITLPLTSEPEDLTVFCLSQHSVLDPKVVGFSVYGASNTSRGSSGPASPDCRTPISIGESGRNSGLRDKLDHRPFDKQWFKRNKSLINSPYTNSKQISLRCQLERGAYVLLPTTFEPAQEGMFNVRIYSVRNTKLRLLDITSRVLKPAILKAPTSFDSKFTQYEAMFMQLADEHKSVNAFELQELLEASLPNDYVKSCATLEVCRQIITAMDVSFSFFFFLCLLFCYLFASGCRVVLFSFDEAQRLLY